MKWERERLGWNQNTCVLLCLETGVIKDVSERTPRSSCVQCSKVIYPFA